MGVSDTLVYSNGDILLVFGFPPLFKICGANLRYGLKVCAGEHNLIAEPKFLLDFTVGSEQLFQRHVSCADGIAPCHTPFTNTRWVLKFLMFSLFVSVHVHHLEVVLLVFCFVIGSRLTPS